MQNTSQQLDWIKSQHATMVETLVAWANINSHTDNMPGLAKLMPLIKAAFAVLGGEMEEIVLPSRIRIDAKGQQSPMPTGNALRIRKHLNAPVQVFLAGHMDTVYPVTTPFQAVQAIDANTLRGPGVTDMKGGLVVMLKALEALERSSIAGKIGWEVLINPDEEEGSPSSESLFIEAAKRCHLALLYEPSFADGALVDARKGSVNFILRVQGRSAHAGRDFFSGRNAISAMARFIQSIDALTDEARGITVNVGRIEGGQASNIVPDFALCRFNVRMNESLDFSPLIKQIEKAAEACNSQEGFQAELIQTAARVPKPFDKKNQQLFQAIKASGEALGIPLQSRPSGGVCDGNILSSHGVPTIDTLGVVGGNIHTENEYVLLNSLTERACLSAHFLMNLL